jgi:glucose-6-phosphate isomerase, archaeal
MQTNGTVAYKPPSEPRTSETQPIRMDLSTGVLTGAGIRETCRTLGQLKGLFGDEKAASSMNPELLIYRVQAFQPVPEGEPGGLFWGATFIQPGLVGDEYFMTKGHFHALRDRAEYYVALQGEGALILMDENRRTWFEPMLPGSVHYIPARIAHRVANIGPDVLTFIACWPSDAGHDYETIVEGGFSARLRCVNGRPELIVEP